LSWDINRVLVIGRLTRDVELKYTPSGAPVANFGFAVATMPSKDGSDNVSFFNIVAWGKIAENISNYLSKGKQVAIDGRLNQRRWKAQDGSNRSVVEIIAERVEFLGAVGDNGGNAKQGNAKGVSHAQIMADDKADWNPTPLNNDEDVPF